jgi:TolB-like protein/Tfp pilus assembly protein PilF
MASERRPDGPFRFGRFEFDLRARELRKDGIRVRLQDQPFEALAMLLERPGEVLTREELRTRLWSDGTFVDFEHGLNAAVKRLRAALGDNAERPRFIETLHRRGYRFIGPVEQAGHHQAARPVDGANGKQRLAILPFSTLSGTPAHEYFAEGLREEMITGLGRMCAGRLGIIARTSSTLIQRTATRIRDIGQALRVDFVVEGNVRREGDRARITVQLVETRGETQLWADSYERRLADCFTVQAEVATDIVNSLAALLLPIAGDVPQIGTRHGEAHQAYLKGRYHWNKPGDDGIVPSIAFFEQAVALDRRFAAAHAALGRARLAAVNYHVLEPRAALEAARGDARRALALDPTESEAHLTLAEVARILEWNWTAAEQAYRTALAFNPSNVAIHRHYGLFLAARRRTAEATAATDHAYELDPLCLVVNTSAAWVRFLGRDYAPAIERCRHTLDMDSGFAAARRLLTASLIQAGRREEAAIELDSLAAEALDPITVAWLAHGIAANGDPARARGILDQLEDLARNRYVSPYHRALAHTGVGNHERALNLIEQALAIRDPAVFHLAVDPRFEPLASNRRYQTLVETLALPD